MRRYICLILPLLLLLCGCAKQKKIDNPLYFYYRTTDVFYFGDDGVIDREVQEAGPLWNMTGEMSQQYFFRLNQYLQGPESDGLLSTFPEGSALLDLAYFGDKVSVVVNDAFARLTGMDLSLACACLTLTCCEMIGAKTVEISARDGTLLDGSATITMTYSQLVLEDLCRVPVDPN